jgi:hypothetical protein
MAVYKEFYDVDYESVKSRLKTYLSEQTTLTDYNYEGSAISTWLNLVSYVIVYINSILNFVGNELFITSAQVEDNVLKSAYQLNYLPRRKSAPSIQLSVVNTKTSDVVIPEKTTFLMGDIKVSTIAAQTATASTTTVITAYEGEWVEYQHIFQGNDFETFKLADREEVDQENFHLYVGEDEWKSIFAQENFYDDDNPAEIFYIKYLDTFQISFDRDNGIFAIPEIDDVITVQYLKTNGATHNGTGYTGSLEIETAFADSEYLTSITTTDTLADGLDEEPMTSVAQNAPLAFGAVGRCVTEDDYNVKIKEMPLYSQLADMVIYSSHKDVTTKLDEFPVEEIDANSRLDKGYFVFSGLRRTLDTNWTPTYTYMTAGEQADVISFFDPYKFIQVFGKYRAPQILQITPTITVKLLRNFNVDRTAFELAIHEYLEDTIVGFNKTFSISDLVTFVKSYEFVNYCSVAYDKYFIFHRPNNIAKCTISSIVPGAPLAAYDWKVGHTVIESDSLALDAEGVIEEIDALKNHLIIRRTTTIPKYFTFAPSSYIYNTTLTNPPPYDKIAASGYFNSAVIRIGNEIVPESIEAANFFGTTAIVDNGTGSIHLFGDPSTTIGTINYDTGYITIMDRFNLASDRKIKFELVSDISLSVTKETFLDHTKATVEYV